MSLNSTGAQLQQSLEDSQTTAWASIGLQHDEVQAAAERMRTIELDDPEPDSDEIFQQRTPLCPLERLPDEILMQIMKCLDSNSLYRLSQTTPKFLQLSFDSVFESDSEWRTFRCIVDGLSEGPKRRLMGGTLKRRRDRLANASSGISESIISPESRHKNPAERAGKLDIEQPIDKVMIGIEDEGETIKGFMAREVILRVFRRQDESSQEVQNT